MEPNRLKYLDIAKGLAILAVVWAHILVVGWSHKLIYSFHMPFFFLVSGMLFNRDKFPSFGSFLKKRAKRLLLPYLIYSVVTWAIWAVFRVVRGDEVQSLWMPLAQTFIAQGSGAYMVHNSALWFIPCLFAVELMYFAVSKFRTFTRLLLSFSAAALGILMAHCFGDSYLFCLPWNLDAAFLALPFYCVGNLLTERFSLQGIYDMMTRKVWASVTVLIALTAVLWVLSRCFGECSMGSSSYQCNEWLFIGRAFVGCTTLLLFSALLASFTEKVSDPLVYFGQKSLDVMCLHIPIKGVVILVIEHFISVEVSSSFGMSGIAFLVTMAAVTVCIMLIDRFIRRNK